MVDPGPHLGYQMQLKQRAQRLFLIGATHTGADSFLLWFRRQESGGAKVEAGVKPLRASYRGGDRKWRPGGGLLSAAFMQSGEVDTLCFLIIDSTAHGGDQDLAH